MSFRCQKCGDAQGDGTTPITVVIERRNKVYPVRRDAKGDVIDKGGAGYETVREIKACSRCVPEEL